MGTSGSGGHLLTRKDRSGSSREPLVTTRPEIPSSRSPLALRIEEMGRLAGGWDGAEGVAPNQQAVQGALQIAAILDRLDVEPDAVVADPDGGIVLYLVAQGPERTPRDRVSLRADNDGDFVLLRSPVEGRSRADLVRPESLAQAIDAMRDYVGR